MAENYKLELDTSQMTHSTATLDGNTINLNADTVGTDTFTVILKDENDEVLDTTTGVVNVVKTSLTVDSTASVNVGEVITVLGTVENLSPLCAVWGEITGNGTAPLLTINKVSDTTINYIIDATNADAGTYTLRTNIRQDNVDFTTIQTCELTVVGHEVVISFNDNVVDITDTVPYTETFEITNRPAGSIISVVSSDTSIFTVDTTNVESGSFDIVGVANGNGTITLSVISGGEVVASGILPVAVSIVPDGKTVVPVNDVQLLLKCAGIFDKSYTTINEVLADATTLAGITISNNAVDYLVRSTDFASAVAADQTAMTDIGADNYCADTLLADSTWLNAIYGSSYRNSVLNSTVPQMTSNTAPSGVVSVSSTYSGTWKSYGAFNDSYEWYATSNNNQFVQYEFPEAMTLKAFEYTPSNNAGYAAAGYTITLTGSNDGTNFTQLATHSGITSRYEYDLPLNETAYKYYKMHILCENPGQYSICPNTHKIQYYGRQDV